MLPSYITDPNPNLYLSNNYVVLDWETTNLDKGSPYNPDNKLVLGCWTIVEGGIKTKKHIFGGGGSYSELLEDINKSEYIVAHNCKFELGWLVRCGYDLSSKPIYCTQLGEYVIAGNRPWLLNLDACLARRNFGGKESLVAKMIKHGICPSEIPPKWLLKYCEIDVDQCERLFIAQRNYHQTHGLAAVMYSRCLLTPVLVDLEFRGMQLDPIRVKKLYEDKCAEFEHIEIELSQLVQGLNFGSPQQVANYLFNELNFKIPVNHRGKPLLNKATKDWPEGIPKVDAPTLEKLKPKTAQQKAFLTTYRKRSKVKKQHENLQKMWNCCEESGGELHFIFNQTRTATHRLSSSGREHKLQGQNLDRNFKPLFKPRFKDWLFEEDDAAQLEYRFVVDHADDKAGKDDIANNVDVHYLSASTMFPEYKALPEGMDKKALRTSAKKETFKPLYYGRSGNPQQMAYYKAFREKHAQISELHEVIIEQVVQTGQYRTFSGLVFYWPSCRRSGRDGFATFSNQICNYFAQNGATAEMIPLAVVYMWHRMKLHNCQSFMVNTVHDSIETEVHPEEKELISKLATQAITQDSVDMLYKLYDYEFTVPMESETEVSTHWGNNSDWEDKYL